ncbi:MAG: nucleotidyltransferase family protein [Desulfobacterales bacterium]|nr:nucleotidyltransferase family protein [Desulfobacterales bacterium]
MQMTDQEILDVLRREKPYLREKYGLLSVGLFGSCAKGAQGPESDVDLLVEFAEPRFDSLAGLQIYLERRLGKPVDLIRKRKNLGKRFVRRIEKNIQYA